MNEPLAQGEACVAWINQTPGRSGACGQAIPECSCQVQIRASPPRQLQRTVPETTHRPRPCATQRSKTSVYSCHLLLTRSTESLNLSDSFSGVESQSRDDLALGKRFDRAHCLPLILGDRGCLSMPADCAQLEYSNPTGTQCIHI